MFSLLFICLYFWCKGGAPTLHQTQPYLPKWFSHVIIISSPQALQNRNMSTQICFHFQYAMIIQYEVHITINAVTYFDMSDSEAVASWWKRQILHFGVKKDRISMMLFCHANWNSLLTAWKKLYFGLCLFVNIRWWIWWVGFEDLDFAAENVCSLWKHPVKVSAVMCVFREASNWMWFFEYRKVVLSF